MILAKKIAKTSVGGLRLSIVVLMSLATGFHSNSSDRFAHAELMTGSGVPLERLVMGSDDDANNNLLP